MALFKLRKGSDEANNAVPAAETVQAVRRRARHRLIGAVVLVAAGVLGFPLLFDTQPRPVAVDIAIDIPDKALVKPLPSPVAPATTGSASVASAGNVPASVARTPAPAPAPAPAPTPTPAPAPTPATASAPPVANPTKPATAPPASRVAAAASLDAKEEVIASDTKKPLPQASTAQAAIKNEAPVKPAPEAKPLPKPEPAPAVTPDNGAKAQALLEGRGPEATAARFIVQVGAFADVDKARDVRVKVEKAGLKTYTHVAQTKEGPRTRVRVGPFDSKAEANQAAERIKALDLPAAILTL
jgi:DedD protein